MTCCTLKGSNSVLQPLHDKRAVSMSGFMGAAQEFWNVYHPIDRVVTGIHNKRIIVPIHGQIASYVFLIRGLDEDTGWRVFEIKCDVLLSLNGRTLTVPDLMELPSLASRRDGDELLQLVELAAKNP